MQNEVKEKEDVIPDPLETAEERSEEASDQFKEDIEESAALGHETETEAEAEAESSGGETSSDETGGQE